MRSSTTAPYAGVLESRDLGSSSVLGMRDAPVSGIMLAVERDDPPWEAGLEGESVATLEELLDIEGVVAAGEFNRDGSLADFEAKMDMSEEMAQMTAQFCATVTMMFDTLAGSFTQLSGMNWVPQQGRAYSGGDWTVAIGGNRGVFVETAKADFNRLFQALGEGR